MSNFSKVWPVGLTNAVSPIDHTELEQLDTNVSKTINATDGSTHAPSAKVTVGGAGIGGNLPTGEFWQFGADAGAKRTKTTGCPASPVARLFSAGLSSGSFVQGGGAALAFTRAIECVPDGATITLIEARVRIVNSHAALPTNYPRMTVQRVDHATGGLVTFLKNTDAGAGVNETFAPANVAAYNALGNTGFTYTPNQNNVVDKSLYTFLINVLDEDGGGAISGNIFISFKITYTLSQQGLF
jgi:hypothetical protein